MKHLYKFFLFLMALLLPATALAHDFEVDGIYYNHIGTNAYVTFQGLVGDGDYIGDVIIPATVTYGGTTYSVISIGYDAFRGSSDLTSVSIPNSVTSIGEYAFCDCTGLTSIDIPNSITTIGKNAFSGSAWFNNQPDGLVYAGLVAYKYKGTMPNGTSINLRDGTLSITNYAFSSCTGLTSITIPNSVTSIGEAAFQGCSSLTDLRFNAISCADFSPDYPPFGGTFISTIEVGNSVQKIPANFVRNLTTLRTVSIGNSVTSIGRNAFSDCNCMTDVTIGNSVAIISDNAFYGCSGLTSISIPNSVTEIGANAFKDCRGLTSVNIPCSVNIIRSKAFYGCNSLNSVYSYADNPPIMGSSDCFSVYNSANLYVPYQSQDSYKNTYYWNYFNKIYGVDSEGNVLATGISLNVTGKNLNVNQTFKLIATITPDITTNKTVNWTSSNTSVAKVDNDGLVTATADGTATITVTTTDGTNLNASCMVTVTSIPATSISLNKTSLTLDINESYTLMASVLPSNATDKSVTWKSSNNAIATISSNGVVTPKTPGNVIITATTSDGTNLSASCQVTVVKLVKSITLNENSLTLTLPETAQLIATITPSDATIPTLTWTSSKTSVATVDNNGLITSVGVGTATIKVTTTDGTDLSASCYVTVNKQLVTSIALNETYRVMNIGDTFQLVADIAPDNASNKALTWSTGNASVATVDNNGLVTARSCGTTYVRASATDGSYIYANCTIEVLPDYYLTLDTLSHIRGEAAQVVDLQVSLVNKNPISGIQFDITLPSGVEFNLIDSLPDVWLDDARKTRTHSISASQLSSGKYRILISSSSSKDLKGYDGVVCHLNMLLPQQHNIGDYSINISNIIASEADETRHTLNNTSAIIHYYYIVGDADANAIVDIADYTATASKILGKSPSPFYSDAANVDGNNSLDVVDLVGITNIALEIKPITIRQAPVRNSIANRLLCGNLKFNAAGEAEVNIDIDCAFDFAGFQMDVDMPNGLILLDANIGEMVPQLGLATEVMQDGKIRLLGTSFTDAVVSGSCPKLLKLKVKAGMNYMQGSNIEFSDIIFAERDLTSHSFDGSCIEYIEPSSVYELTDGIRIYVENGNIIVDTPISGTVQLIAVDGCVTEYQARVGHNVYTFGVDGIYVVHFNGKTLKIRL